MRYPQIELSVSGDGVRLSVVLVVARRSAAFLCVPKGQLRKRSLLLVVGGFGDPS